MAELRSLCWIRRDLRISDSSALAEAISGDAHAAVVFVWDEKILSSLQDKRNRRVTFIHQSLEELDSKLRKCGSHLVVLRGDPAEEIPKLAKELGASFVVWARDYDPHAIVRDDAIEKILKKQDLGVRIVNDIVIFEPGELATQTNGPFKVYSPFARAWHAKFDADLHAIDHHAHLDQLIKSSQLPKGQNPSLETLGFEKVDLWLESGEDAAQKRLRLFAKKIDDYGRSRDFPADDGTSTLSVDFRFGTISIRAAVREALKSDTQGARKWLAELIWRDFYQHILFHFPDVVKKPFQKEFENVDYPGTDADWGAWRDGKTGYPLVDAAMRCLNETGYMHNRLRMVVASFLSKDLLLEYKQGESWFAKQLLDYELASNNGGWQWASSVGCDPQPYFRIFNPILQSKKFDPEGAFIKKWVPELKELDEKHIHFPAEASEMELTIAGITLGKEYPKPCVDHATQKAKAIALLEHAKKKSASQRP